MWSDILVFLAKKPWFLYIQLDGFHENSNASTKDIKQVLGMNSGVFVLF